MASDPFGDWWGGLTGKTDKKAGQAQQAAAGQTLAGAGQAIGQAGQAYGQIGQQAGALGAGYDTGAQASMGANAADYMQKANAAAQGQAGQAAGAAATQGAQKAAQAARAGGLNKGQAALAGAQQTGDIYSGALQKGLESGRGQYMAGAQQFAGQGAEMAGRGLSAAGGQVAAGAAQGNIGAQQGALGAGQVGQGQAQGAQTWGAVKDVAGGVAGLISDIRAKRDVQPAPDMLDAILRKIKPIAFRYKEGIGDPGAQVGVSAQDLEKTPLAPVVQETPQGKQIDTRKLSTANLDLIIELAKRVAELEAR